MDYQILCSFRARVHLVPHSGIPVGIRLEHETNQGQAESMLLVLDLYGTTYAVKTWQ